MKPRQHTPLLMWGGFVDDRLHVWRDGEPHDEAAIYTSRRVARQYFTDVRRVEVREVKRTTEER